MMIEMQYTEKRSESRLSERHPLRVQGNDINGQFFVEITLTENVSSAGLCVVLDHEVATGTNLQIYFNIGSLQKQAYVTTCWVQSLSGRWRVGLQLSKPPKGWHGLHSRD
jgi:hypothetical protein